MKNMHITPDQMQEYVNNRLPEAERAVVEQELSVCETCLELFIGFMNDSEAVLQPLQPDFDLMEQRVVAELVSEQGLHRRQSNQVESDKRIQKSPSRVRTWLQHPVTHYTVAASITLLLLASGTFSSFSEKLVQRELNENKQQTMRPDPSEASNRQSESWSDRIVDQTGSWLDGLRASRFK
ncbi:hypothetical protein BK133_18260 [Paenibacillus sp. FSL H8-0548]|uniref:hypothetical protein n=1 Tax=Paenibacillus sp. FSL H8-0548 TaxID=1920422 RepID=UPI00096D856A|nr:hypothetical protein [Paenibacillus sp. FSL H8-0548]OMF29084.1 hypothetical protein BK133_18260 [Paenibacillus sp. FSL H8-0548]